MEGACSAYMWEMCVQAEGSNVLTRRIVCAGKANATHKPKTNSHVFLLLDVAEEFQDEDVCTTIHNTKETCLQVEGKKGCRPEKDEEKFLGDVTSTTNLELWWGLGVTWGA